MEFLQRHPLLVKTVLRPVANAPLLSKRMMVLFRAHMGATAFEIHDVDMERGRIGIGGVEEIMFGSKIVHLLHTELAARMGTEEKDRALYEIGVKLCTWEVSQALESGRWAPPVLAPLIFNSQIFEQVRKSPAMRRFFKNVIDMMSRLITDEGGWGHLEFDLNSDPVRISLSNSQEAAWLGRSEKPVCSLYTGIVAGYSSTLTGERWDAREVECAAMGAPKCVFEIYKK
jgi:predicted hydrocarbon binding protein